MNRAVPHKIGASLILGVVAAASIFAGRCWSDRPRIEFILLRSLDGYPTLGVVLNPPAWRYATAASSLPPERALTLDVPRQRFSAIVAKGIQLDHLDNMCHSNWSVIRVEPTPGGSMRVFCHCMRTGKVRVAAFEEAI